MQPLSTSDRLIVWLVLLVAVLALVSCVSAKSESAASGATNDHCDKPGLVGAASGVYSRAILGFGTDGLPQIISLGGDRATLLHCDDPVCRTVARHAIAGGLDVLTASAIIAATAPPVITARRVPADADCARNAYFAAVCIDNQCRSSRLTNLGRDVAIRLISVSGRRIRLVSSEPPGKTAVAPRLLSCEDRRHLRCRSFPISTSASLSNQRYVGGGEHFWIIGTDEVGGLVRSYECDESRCAEGPIISALRAERMITQLSAGVDHKGHLWVAVGERPSLSGFLEDTEFRLVACVSQDCSETITTPIVKAPNDSLLLGGHDGTPAAFIADSRGSDTILMSCVSGKCLVHRTGVKAPLDAVTDSEGRAVIVSSSGDPQSLRLSRCLNSECSATSSTTIFIDR